MTDLHKDVELIDPDDLIPYSNNPKEHPDEQIKKIASSIKNYGWDQPIVIDEENEIIKGHGRLQAARVLDLNEVPVIQRKDLSESEAKAARIADNRTAESEWDDDLLASEIDLLMDENSIDIDSLGFDESEFADLLGNEDDSETVDDPEIEFATELLYANNYVVFQFDNTLDWQVIQDEFELDTVKALDSEGEYQQQGVGRVLDGQELLDRL